MMNERWGDAFLEAKRQVCDPLADAVVAQVFDHAETGAAGAFMQSLVRNDELALEDLPQEIATYLRQTAALPHWADHELIRRGEACFQRWGMLMSMSLVCSSLPSCYAAGKSVQALALTARYETDAKRRTLETAQFLFDVMAPSGLSLGGRGIRSTQKVRLMHAAVRYLIRARAAQDPNIWNEAWGQPINQEDLAGTLLSFGWMVIEALRRLEIEVSDADAAAYLHTWNVVGHIIGIDEDLLPVDAADAAALLAAIQRRLLTPSAEGQELTRALVEMVQGLCPGPLSAGWPQAMICHLVGDEIARTIGLDPNVRQHERFGWLLAIGDLFDREQSHHRAMARLAEPMSRMMLEHAPLMRRGDARPPFYIPTELRDHWQLGDPPPVAAAKQRFEQIAARAADSPLPGADKPWIAGQHWEHLLFAHWPLPAAVLQATLPEGLAVETFDGTAWLSIVAMQLTHAHFRHVSLPDFRLSPELNLGDFPELNLRTYVRYGDRTGVYFYSLDTASHVIVALTRHLWHLPYHHADLELSLDGDAIGFQHQRREHNAAPAAYACRFAPTGEPFTIQPGTLDAFLADREIMFTRAPDGSLFWGRVTHPSWTLQPARAEIVLNEMAQSIGVALPSVAPIVRYSRETDAICYPIERLTEVEAGGSGQQARGIPLAPDPAPAIG